MRELIELVLVRGSRDTMDVTTEQFRKGHRARPRANSGYHKLTNEDKANIYRLRTQHKRTFKAIAELYGVNESTIRKHCKYRSNE